MKYQCFLFLFVFFFFFFNNTLFLHSFLGQLGPHSLSSSCIYIWVLITPQLSCSIKKLWITSIYLYKHKWTRLFRFRLLFILIKIKKKLVFNGQWGNIEVSAAITQHHLDYMNTCKRSVSIYSCQRMSHREAQVSF